MFYDRYVAICRSKGIAPSKAAEEIGINKASVTNWKKAGYTPRADTLQRIADYFGVSVSYLLGMETKTAPTPEGIKNPPGPEAEGLTDIQTEAMEFMRSLTEDQLRRFIAMGRAAFEKGS